MVIQNWKQIGKVTKLDKWVPNELTESQKKHCFEVASLTLCNKSQLFLDRIMICDEKWISYHNWQWQALWLDREEVPKRFPKPNLHQKKVMVTVWWSATHLTHYSFLNPGETITSEKYAQQINEMHQKLQHMQPALINRKGPILLQDNIWPYIVHPMLQKLNELGYEVLPHLPYSPDLWPTDYHFFQDLYNFLQRRRFHKQQEAEYVFQELVKSQSMDFYATGINKLIPRWQKMCWLNDSYFD